MAGGRQRKKKAMRTKYFDNMMLNDYMFQLEMLRIYDSKYKQRVKSSATDRYINLFSLLYSYTVHNAVDLKSMNIWKLKTKIRENYGKGQWEKYYRPMLDNLVKKGFITITTQDVILFKDKFYRRMHNVKTQDIYNFLKENKHIEEHIHLRDQRTKILSLTLDTSKDNRNKKNIDNLIKKYDYNYIEFYRRMMYFRFLKMKYLFGDNILFTKKLTKKIFGLTDYYIKKYNKEYGFVKEVIHRKVLHTEKTLIQSGINQFQFDKSHKYIDNDLFFTGIGYTPSLIYRGQYQDIDEKKRFLNDIKHIKSIFDENGLYIDNNKQNISSYVLFYVWIQNNGKELKFNDVKNHRKVLYSLKGLALDSLYITITPDTGIKDTLYLLDMEVDKIKKQKDYTKYNQSFLNDFYNNTVKVKKNILLKAGESLDDFKTLNGIYNGVHITRYSMKRIFFKLDNIADEWLLKNFNGKTKVDKKGFTKWCSRAFRILDTNENNFNFLNSDYLEILNNTKSLANKNITDIIESEFKVVNY